MSAVVQFRDYRLGVWFMASREGAVTAHPYRNAAISLLFGVVSLFEYDMTHARTAAAPEGQHRAPIHVPGIREPEEMRAVPRPISIPSEPERMLAIETTSGAKMKDPATLLPALNRVLAKFPDYSDGYAMRALALLCSSGDRMAALADINSALKYLDSSRVKESATQLLSMRAKIEQGNGDYAHALTDLESAITADLVRAEKFTNSGAIAPEKTAKPCTWTEPDMDAFVEHFPHDYRSYMLRGLYFIFFTNFNADPTLRKRTIDDYEKAAEIKGDSALPHYFAAKAFLKWSFVKQASMSDEQRIAFYRAPLDELDKALQRDPKLLPALSDRANIYLHLNQFQNAIRDYDRYLEIDPNNAGALDGRGHAKIGLGKLREAIDDFGKTISVQNGSDSAEYETRADAYLKNEEWHLAIKDLTTVISRQIGSQLLLMNISQFRAIYPEYKVASDEAVALKLNQTFLPNIKYEDFSKSFLQTNHGWALDPGIYLKRSRAYLSAGNWHRAAIDYRRAENAAPDFSKSIDDDRWGEVARRQSARVYIDLKTFDDDPNVPAKMWIKEVQVSDGDMGPYALEEYELNCSARRIRATSIANYDASGELIGHHEGGTWNSIVPETIGETLYNGVCRPQ
jgi:tetratricopeptide (TPR) repeat protein